MLQLTCATAPENGWPAVAPILAAPNAPAGASSNSPPTRATTARTDHARIAPHPENTLNKLRIADRPPGDHNDPLAGLPPQPIPTLPPDATTYRPTRRTSRRMSQAGFRGGFESRTICPRERRLSTDATTQEVPRGAVAARCSSRAGVRSADLPRRAGYRFAGGDVAQACAAGGGRREPEARSTETLRGSVRG